MQSPRTIYSADHEAFRDVVRKFFEKEAVPHHAKWEEEGQVSRDLWLKAGEAGLLCPQVAEEYGGAGADWLYSAIVMEEIAKMGLSGIGFGLHSDIVAVYIEHFGSEEQKKYWLPKMVSGEAIGAIAMTEPGAGSDLQGVKTTAIAQGDEYVINGSKTFITNGQLADVVIVVCKTDPTQGAKGVSLILVERGREGFSRGRNLEKVGMKAQDTSELFFQDVRVPKTNILGQEGQGFIYLMKELPQERLGIAITAIASAESALDITVKYVQERKAFGKTISSFQNTKFKLAEMAAEVRVGRFFLDRCMEMHMKGELDIPTAAMAKM
ncbi:MAG TPA: acyl-CoA dehydrogenase family protein, partial [Pseudomonadales bacterium]|nr:acyl-CoA dehydrogenase family protein [Pseudomonadales bacterium]